MDEFLTPLKDLSRHNCHGRIYIPGEFAADALNAISEGGEGDVLIWHDWYSEHTYEIVLMATNKLGIDRNLKLVQDLGKRNTQLSWTFARGTVFSHMWLNWS